MTLSYLPAQMTPLLGREVELDAVVERLNQEHVRLLSLIGPAGVGKTRLALAVMDCVRDQFPDGVVFVDLAPLREPTLVPPAIARALGLADTGTRPLLDRLAEYLSAREVLLVLDNFEQIVPAAGQVLALLSAAPRLKILVTSRIPLRLRWEQTVRLFPLAVPESDVSLPIDQLVRIPSVALFVQRARAQRADFVPTPQHAPLLIRLAKQLDGLPLALELAAGQINALPLAAIVRRLEGRVQALRWDAWDLPDRQRSLQAAIDWSYELLSAEAQRLLRHLGVFAGRVALDAITAVLPETNEDETLAGMVALVEKSLVLPAPPDDADPEPSFAMLETVREYAREKLAVHGELEAAQQAHAAYFVRLAERADAARGSREQVIWLRRLEVEHDNLRSALRRLLDTGPPDQALQLAGALGHFWFLRGYFTEGGRWLEEALRAAPAADSRIRIHALLRAARLWAIRGDPDLPVSVLHEALALAQERADRPGIALALSSLGASSTLRDATEGERLLREALALWEELGDAFHIALTLAGLAFVRRVQGRLQEAAELYTAAITRLNGIGEVSEVTQVLFAAAVTQILLGDRAVAVRLIQEGLKKSVFLQERWLVNLGTEVALLLVGESGDLERRARLLGAADALAEIASFKTGLSGAPASLSLDVLREQIERQEELQRAYRRGRTLRYPEAAALALELLEEFETTPAVGEMAPAPPAPSSPLSPRDQEILRLVAGGLTNKEIGQQLFLSPRTVEHHLTSIFNKLGADSRAQAVAVAARESLL